MIKLSGAGKPPASMRPVEADNARFDVRGSDLSLLVMMCLSQQGQLSNNRRKQFRYKVPEEIFDAIETQTKQVLAEDADT